MNILNVIQLLEAASEVPGIQRTAAIYEMVALSILSVTLIIFILWIVGTWKVLTKANQPGWKVLIPIYNKWTLCEISGVNPYWSIIEIAFAIVYGIVIGIINFTNTVIADKIFYLLPIVSIYLNMLLGISISKSFSRSDGFGVLNIFFSPICHMIIGFSNDKYIGPRPMYDPFLGKKENDNAADNKILNQEEKTTNTFCTRCGSKIIENNKYCTKCGKEL